MLVYRNNPSAMDFVANITIISNYPSIIIRMEDECGKYCIWREAYEGCEQCFLLPREPLKEKYSVSCFRASR